VDVLASSVGSFANARNIENTIRSEKRAVLKAKTVESYIGRLRDAYLIDRALRYDVKGRKLIAAQAKYYFADPGLRNARLDFRQIEETHLMENVLFNELKVQGFDVNVGVVETFGKNAAGSSVRKQLEIDFVANRGMERYYIQSALSISEPEKALQEKRPFGKLDDSFRKIVVVKGKMPARTDENGYVVVGLVDFLLAPEKILA